MCIMHSEGFRCFQVVIHSLTLLKSYLLIYLSMYSTCTPHKHPTWSCSTDTKAQPRERLPGLSLSIRKLKEFPDNHVLADNVNHLHISFESREKKIAGLFR